MTVSINAASAVPVDPAASSNSTNSASLGSAAVPDGVTNAFGGGAVVQSGGAGSIITKALVGAAGGAAAGAGYGLLAGMVSFLPHVTVPMGALIGAAGGAVLGIAKGLWDNRKSTLALKDQQQQAAMMQMQQTAPTQVSAAPKTGPVYKAGASGDKVKTTQRMLKTLGLYKGKISGAMNEGTVTAIKRYELMKGAAPTGASTPELRDALYHDGKLSKQFA